MEIVIEPYKQNVLDTLVSIWKYRKLLLYFAIRTTRLRYKETILGWLWLIIKPLVPALISTVIFGKLAEIPSEGVPYFIFFLTGMSLWNFFASSLRFITRSLRGNRKLVTKLYFPRIIIPISSVAPFLVEFCVYLVVLFGAFVFYYIKSGVCYLSFSYRICFAPFFFFMALLLTWGIGFWTSVLNAQARDVRFTLPYLLNLWYFVTPVIYPLSMISPKWRWLAVLNPMTTVVEGFKWSLLGKGELNLGYLTIAVLLVIGIFISGVWFFTVAESNSVDNL